MSNILNDAEWLELNGQLYAIPERPIPNTVKIIFTKQPYLMMGKIGMFIRTRSIWI